jgi:anaerobic selenocysteine-containing dehydrogenase
VAVVEEATDMITRRDLLQRTGAAALALGPWETAFAEYFKPAKPALYPPETVITACGICDSACGMRATI